MVEKCIICKSVPRRGVLRFFHGIPDDEERRLQWISVLSNYLGRNIVRLDGKVCCDHFLPDDYECRIMGKLKKSAIPTLPSLHYQNLESQIKEQTENDNDVKGDNSNTHKGLGENTVKIECEELSIKYEDDVMNNSCTEFTNNLIDCDVQLMDVEKVELREDFKLNAMVQEPETIYLKSTFDPGTAENSLNLYSGVVSNEILVKDKESDESERAFSSEYLTSIMVFIEGIDFLETQKKKTLQAKLKRLNQYIKTLKTSAKTWEERSHVLRLEVNRVHLLLDKLQTENSASAQKLLAVKTNECIEYKNTLSNVWQELAYVKVNLTNCREEKAKLEKNQGLEEMRKEMELLRKKSRDLSEAYRLKTFREVEVEQEMQLLRLRLQDAMGVCRLAGVSLEDLTSLDATEAKYRNSGGLPKTWKYQLVAHKVKTEHVVELEKKEEECKQLKKELARLRKLSDECSNVFRISDVCEYCGM